MRVPFLQRGAKAAFWHAYSRAAVAIGEELRAAREAQGVSVEELAAAVGVTASTVHQYERGQTVPHIARVTQLAWALGITPASLLERLS